MESPTAMTSSGVCVTTVCFARYRFTGKERRVALDKVEGVVKAKLTFAVREHRYRRQRG